MKAVPFKQIARSRNDPARAARIRQRVAEELVTLTLADLRKELGLTQVEAAELLSMTQGQVSQLESRRDHLLSTLRRHIEALGGHLEVTAVVGDKRIRLDV